MSTALGCYIFAGGFSLGLQQAGFKILAHFEDGTFGVASTKLNFPDLPIFTDQADWPILEFRHKVDLVYGNPPCAPWSVAGMSPKINRGYEQRWYEQDERTACVYKHFALLDQLRPRAWVWESVARAWVAGRMMVDDLARRAMEIGYSVSVLLVDGYDCGLPQRRQRMFFVAHDMPISWRRPNESGPRTVREAWVPIGLLDNYQPALAELPPVSKYMQAHPELLASALPGQPLWRAWEKLNPNAEHRRGRPGFVHKRLALDKVANTMTGGATQYHPIEPRYLSVSEAKALCGYPPEYQFSFMPRTEQAHEQMAKAVLPPVARWLGSQILTALRQIRPIHARRVSAL